MMATIKSILKLPNDSKSIQCRKVTFCDNVKLFIDDVKDGDKNDGKSPRMKWVEIGIVDKSQDSKIAKDEDSITDFLVHKVVYESYELPEDDNDLVPDDGTIVFEPMPEDEVEFVVHKVENDSVRNEAEVIDEVDDAEEQSFGIIEDACDKISKLSVENIIEHDKIIAYIDQNNLELASISTTNTKSNSIQIHTGKTGRIGLSPPLQELSLEKIVSAHSDNALSELDISPLNSIQETDSDSDASSEGTMIMMTTEECRKNEQHILESLRHYESLKEQQNKETFTDADSSSIPQVDIDIEELQSLDSCPANPKVSDTAAFPCSSSDDSGSSSKNSSNDSLSHGFDPVSDNKETEASDATVSCITEAILLPIVGGVTHLENPAEIEIPSDVREWKIVLSSIDSQRQESCAALTEPSIIEGNQKSDELENFVHESSERVERIRKRYNGQQPRLKHSSNSSHHSSEVTVLPSILPLSSESNHCSSKNLLQDRFVDGTFSRKIPVNTFKNFISEHLIDEFFDSERPNIQRRNTISEQFDHKLPVNLERNTLPEHFIEKLMDRESTVTLRNKPELSAHELSVNYKRNTVPETFIDDIFVHRPSRTAKRNTLPVEYVLNHDVGQHFTNMAIEEHSTEHLCNHSINTTNRAQEHSTNRVYNPEPPRVVGKHPLQEHFFNHDYKNAPFNVYDLPINYMPVSEQSSNRRNTSKEHSSDPTCNPKDVETTSQERSIDRMFDHELSRRRCNQNYLCNKTSSSDYSSHSSIDSCYDDSYHSINSDCCFSSTNSDRSFSSAYYSPEGSERSSKQKSHDKHTLGTHTKDMVHYFITPEQCSRDPLPDKHAHQGPTHSNQKSCFRRLEPYLTNQNLPNNLANEGSSCENRFLECDRTYFQNAEYYSIPKDIEHRPFFPLKSHERGAPEGASPPRSRTCVDSEFPSDSPDGYVYYSMKV